MADLQNSNLSNDLRTSGNPVVNYSQPSDATVIGGPMGVDFKAYPIGYYSARLQTGNLGVRTFRIVMNLAASQGEIIMTKRRDGMRRNFSLFYSFSYYGENDGDFRYANFVEMSRSGYGNDILQKGQVPVQLIDNRTTPINTSRGLDPGGRSLSYISYNFEWNVTRVTANLHIFMKINHYSNFTPYVYWMS